MTTWVDRVEHHRERRGWSKIELGRRAGIERDNLYKYLEGKVEKPRGDSLRRLASALGVSEIWLTHGIGPRFLTVPLVGYVSAGEEFYPAGDLLPGAGYDEVSLDLDAVDPIAIRVKGRSMLPVYRPGDNLLCSRLPITEARSAVGRDCAVMTRAGEGYVKQLRWSEGIGYFLRSYNPDYPDIEGVDLDWVAPVVIIKRGG